MSDDRKIKHRKVDKEGKGGEPLPKSINPSDEVADQQAKPQSAGVFASGWYWLFAIASLAVVAVFTVYKPQASMDGHDIARAEPKASKLSSIAGSSQERVFAVYPGDRLFTQDELTKLGSNAKRIHLGILGRVYDVTKGLKYYGPEGGYSFFAGRDATRSFVSGDFSDSGLTDDLEGLSIREYLGIADWVGTYEKEYTYVGRLIGRFHNENGEPTVALLDAEEKIRLARELQAEEEDRNKLFPPCNSRWAAGKGEVWCSDKSGGIHRDWVGVPRKLFVPGASAYRCACVKNSGLASDGSETNGRGDLDNPQFKEYKNCNPKSTTCAVDD